MAEGRSLYDEDLVRWSEEQAAAIRSAAASGANLPLDWDNLAEEIESLGKSQRHELNSRLRTIVEHLLKLQHSPARDPRGGWTDTVLRARSEVEDLLSDSPSLRQIASATIERRQAATAELAALSLSVHGELTDAVETAILRQRYSVDEVLGTWLPAGPATRDEH